MCPGDPAAFHLHCRKVPSGATAVRRWGRSQSAGSGLPRITRASSPSWRVSVYVLSHLPDLLSFTFGLNSEKKLYGHSAFFDLSHCCWAARLPWKVRPGQQHALLGDPEGPQPQSALQDDGDLHSAPAGAPAGCVCGCDLHVLHQRDEASE